jgi:hypothetical protein
MRNFTHSIIVIAALVALCLFGGLLATYSPKNKRSFEFTQETTMHQLLLVQNELADVGVKITYRFMVLDSVVMPEAIVPANNITSIQLDAIAKKQKENPNVFFGIRFVL